MKHGTRQMVCAPQSVVPNSHRRWSARRPGPPSRARTRGCVGPTPGAGGAAPRSGLRRSGPSDADTTTASTPGRPTRPSRRPRTGAPGMHRLAGHSAAAGDVGHGGPVVEHLQHCLIALFHQSQLHEHGRPPSHWARTTTAKKVATGGWWTPQGEGVVQVPGPLSPRYRGRVREVSGRYRGHGVHYEPGPHTPVPAAVWTFRGPSRLRQKPPRHLHSL